LLAAREFLAQTPQPSERDVRVALSGNLCRCTGYVNIIDAVLAAAQAGEPA
jgi:carbon-monoxide dehydrogenase small subunit